MKGKYLSSGNFPLGIELHPIRTFISRLCSFLYSEKRMSSINKAGSRLLRKGSSDTRPSARSLQTLRLILLSEEVPLLKGSPDIWPGAKQPFPPRVDVDTWEGTKRGLTIVFPRRQTSDNRREPPSKIARNEASRRHQNRHAENPHFTDSRRFT